MRSQFTFYKSFDDVIEDMTDKQIVEYVKALMDVQFLRRKVDNIKFEDKILNMVWKSQKHSIQSSIDGFLNSQKKEGVKNPYMGVYADPSEGGIFNPSLDPSEGGRQQEEEKEKEKEKEKEEEKGKGKEEEQSAGTMIIVEKIPYREIMDHLNATMQTAYRATDKTRGLIKARFNEGFRLDDFKHVHVVKLAEWGLNEEMSKYLRPETLYGNKFDGYRNQKLTEMGKANVIQQHTGMSAIEKRNLMLGLNPDGSEKEAIA